MMKTNKTPFWQNEAKFHNDFSTPDRLRYDSLPHAAVVELNHQSVGGITAPSCQYRNQRQGLGEEHPVSVVAAEKMRNRLRMI
jgi:hypothetical protein